MPTARSLRILLLGGILVFAAVTLYLQEQNPWNRKARLETPARMAALQRVENKVAGWPPTLGQIFPEIKFFDHEGKDFSMSKLRGKVTLIEIATMSCAACQSFSGGNIVGGFDGFPPQADLGSAEEYLRRFAGVELFSGEINFVQIIIYNLSLKAPNSKELAAWRDHFHLNHSNTFIVSGGEPLANKVSFKMIPGFIVLDRNLQVRFDGSGQNNNPKHELYSEVFPGVRTLLKEVTNFPGRYQGQK